MEQDILFWIEKLMSLLNVLASNSAKQIEYLQKLGTAPSTDELSLELDDMMWVLDEGLSKGRLSERQVMAIKSISMIFDKMSESDDKSIWDISALGKAEEWKKLRESAKEALRCTC